MSFVSQESCQDTHLADEGLQHQTGFMRPKQLSAESEVKLAAASNFLREHDETGETGSRCCADAVADKGLTNKTTSFPESNLIMAGV